jgi:hypothetical protein
MRDQGLVSEARLLVRLRRAKNLRTKLSVLASTLLRPAEVLDTDAGTGPLPRTRVVALACWWIAKLRRQITTKRILRGTPDKARLVDDIAGIIEEVEWDRGTR